MGWTGMMLLGAVTGLAGWWLYPLRVRGGFVPALVAGVLGAVLAKAAGGATGAFLDGETLEWPVCTAAALAATAMTVRLKSRR